MAALVIELLALLGIVCLLHNLVVHLLPSVVDLVTVDVPREWRRWERYRAQQRVLDRLQARVDALTLRLRSSRRSKHAEGGRRRSRSLQVDDSEPKQMLRNGRERKRDQQPTELATAPSALEPKPTSHAEPRRRRRLAIDSTPKKPRTASERDAALLMEPILVLVCGLPGAGKSSLVARLVANDERGDLLYQSVVFDDLLREWREGDEAAEFDPEVWKACQAGMVERIRCHLAQKGDASDRKRPVLLVDDNLPYRSQRKRYAQLATEVGVGFGILHVNTPVDVCRERNASRRDNMDCTRGEYVPADVFERMVTIFEAPDPSRAPWETNTYALSESKLPQNHQAVQVAFEDLVKKALLMLKTQREERARIQQLNEQKRHDKARAFTDVIHLVDLELRKWISNELKAVSTARSKQEAAKRLNAYRKLVLSELKTFQTSSRIVEGSDKSPTCDSNGTASGTTSDHLKRLLQQVAHSARLLGSTGDESVQSQVGQIVALLRSKYVNHMPQI